LVKHYTRRTPEQVVADLEAKIAAVKARAAAKEAPAKLKANARRRRLPRHREGRGPSDPRRSQVQERRHGARPGAGTSAPHRAPERHGAAAA